MINNEDAQAKRMQKRFDKWLKTRNEGAVHAYLDSFPEESFELNTAASEKLLYSLTLMASYLCMLENTAELEPLFWFCSAVSKYDNPLFVSLLMEIFYTMRYEEQESFIIEVN